MVENEVTAESQLSEVRHCPQQNEGRVVAELAIVCGLPSVWPLTLAGMGRK